MNYIRLTCNNGDTFETSINGTPDEVRAYYLGKPAGDLNKDYDEYDPPRFYARVDFLPPPLTASERMSATEQRLRKLLPGIDRAERHGWRLLKVDGPLSSATMERFGRAGLYRATIRPKR